MNIAVPILVTVAVFFLAGFRIAQEYERALVFRLGRFKGTRGRGFSGSFRFSNVSSL